MPSMASRSDNEQGILCAEHLGGLVLIKSSVNEKNIKIEKHTSPINAKRPSKD